MLKAVAFCQNKTGNTAGPVDAGLQELSREFLLLHLADIFLF